MNEDRADIDHEWPLRPWILAAILGLGGLCVWLAADGFDGDPEPWRAALMALAFFAPICAGLTLEREGWQRPALFSLIVGLVMAGIAWRVANEVYQYEAATFWLAAGVVSALLAVPLFQAGFHLHRWKTSYQTTHYHVWTDAISGGGALAFTGLAWLVLALLSELFHAIKIDFLKELIDKGWFGWAFSGVAFGAALGVLRNQVKVLGTLQNVVMLVFSLIAVPLALAVALFLVAVIFSGIDVLWEATRSATPMLLAIAAASFVLVNAVLRDSVGNASGSRVMRGAAFLLAVGILPLAILAAISMGTRIAEYGLSPERIWGLIAIMVAVAYGVAYFVAAIRSRRHGWDTQRQANLHLAVATCVLAFLLAMPLADFGAISASNQLGRLASGKVSAEDFDFDALRWDFGEAGREALATLAKSKDAEIAKLAKEARDAKERPFRWQDEVFDEQAEITDRIVVYPTGRALPDGLKQAIEDVSVCRGDLVCRVYLQPGETMAAVLGDGCVAPKVSAEEAVSPGANCTINSEPFGIRDGTWQVLNSKSVEPVMTADEEKQSLVRERQAIESGDVKIAPATERRIFVGEKPVGGLFN